LEQRLVDVWYCRAKKAEGKPIMVRTFKDGKPDITNTDQWEMNLFDKNGKRVKVRIKFNNTFGKPKQSGATSMLEVLQID